LSSHPELPRLVVVTVMVFTMRPVTLLMHFHAYVIVLISVFSRFGSLSHQLKILKLSEKLFAYSIRLLFGSAANSTTA